MPTEVFEWYKTPNAGRTILLPHELLHPLTPGVSHVDRSVRSDSNIVRQSKLAVVVSETAEAHQNLAVAVNNRHRNSIRRLGWLVTTV